MNSGVARGRLAQPCARPGPSSESVYFSTVGAETLAYCQGGWRAFLKPRKFGSTLKRKAMGEPVEGRPGERGCREEFWEDRY